MQKIFQSFISIILFIFSINLYAQESEILKYLDDGGISRAKNLIKIEPLKLYEGNLQLNYERYIAENWSLEVGAGVLLNYYNQPIPWNWLAKVEDEDCTLNNPNTGLSLMVAPRFYAAEWSESFYFSIPLNYKFYPKQMHLIDCTVTFGWQKIFDNGILIDLSAGLGMKFQNSIDKKTYIFDASSRNDNKELIEAFPPGTELDIEESFPDKIKAYAPLSIKIGYRFRTR